MTPLEKALQRTLGVEGGDSDDPDDHGGATRYGVTEAVARAFGYTGDMKDLPWSTAVAIYKANYWDKLSLDSVAMVSESVALEVFDTAINCGVGTEGMFLQRALNALNNGGSAYPDLAVDGAVGSATVKALAAFLAKRGAEGERVLLRILNSLQCVRYLEIAERDGTQESFMYGWVLNRVSFGADSFAVRDK